jgi:methionyl-tRNA synthetase
VSFKKNKFYVTTPIYYITAKPHLGSLYSTVLADITKRWNQLYGKDTFLLTGTDEHGQKIVLAAEKAGKKPQEFVDSFINSYKTIWKKYEINYDYFVRTTDQEHKKSVQLLIELLEKKGDIYKGFYEGWYCTPCETFIIEKDIENKEKAPLCPSCGRSTNKVSEDCYYFNLSKYQDKLLKFYKENPNFVVPKERFLEVINFVKSGLKDLSISRTTVKWGILFPKDKKHTVYVWADALINYISAIGYGQDKKKFDYWWPADLHILGKDIFRFHAVYWPAFLMAADLPLPKKLLVHGWIKIGGQKMSKSLKNVVDPDVLYEKYGPEPIRYYLAKQIAITQDGEFSVEDLEEKIISDLANSFGNLLNRMLLLAEKNNCLNYPCPKKWDTESKKLFKDCKNIIEKYIEHTNNYHFHLALTELWRFIGQVNAYFHSKKPWVLAKSNKEKFSEVISAVCHSLSSIALLLWPIMPSKMEELFLALGLEFKLSGNEIDNLRQSEWNEEFNLKKIPVLFEKPIPEKNMEEKENYIDISDLEKIELLVGTIEKCEDFPESEKLLKLQVNFGERGMRQIMAGIKKYYSPEDIIGKQSIFVFNLKPRKMMGIESQGMMLMAKDEKDMPIITTVAKNVSNGTRLS